MKWLLVLLVILLLSELLSRKRENKKKIIEGSPGVIHPAEFEMRLMNYMQKEESIPREMQRGCFKKLFITIAAFQLVGYSVWSGEDVGSNPACYTRKVCSSTRKRI